jgi:hypothetical protein
MEQHAELLKRLRETTQPEEIKLLVDQIDEINTAEPEYEGFKAEGEKQGDLWFVSTYQDEVASVEGASFRFYFVCDAGGDDNKCQTVITSKGWRRKHEVDGWVKGQRYYCRCNAGYNQKWGCLVQLKLPKDPMVYYMRAQIPDDDTLDLMAMRAEKYYFKKGMTNKQLWDALPEMQPEGTSFLRPVEKNMCSFTDRKFFDSLPEYKWVDILTYVNDA